MYDHCGFDEDPGPYYRKALAGYEAALGVDHVESFEARYRLADYLDRRGDVEAAPLFDDLVARLRSTDPPVSASEAGWMLGPCCDHLRRQGREVEAEAIEAWAASADRSPEDQRGRVAWAEMAFGPDSPELGDALERLSIRCSVDGLIDEAEEAAVRALANFHARLGPDDPTTLKAAGRLSRLQGRPRELAALPSPPRRLTRDRPKRFDDAPWRDERRADLILAYLDAAGRERDDDDPTGAVMAIVGMTFMADLDEQWGVTLELIAGSPDDERVLKDLATGPLEGLLGRFDAAAIDRVEDQASHDPRFPRVLSGVWRHGMSHPVWSRVRALLAAVSDPLPGMWPLDPGSTTDG